MVVRASHSLSILITAIALALPAAARAEQPLAPAPLAPPALQPPSATAALQPPLAPPAQTVASTTMPGAKDPSTAFSLSLLGTVAGAGLMVAGASADNGTVGLLGFAGVLAGPSLGHFYAGETGRGLAQVGVRAGGAGLMLGGGIWLIYECFSLTGEACEGGAGPALLMATGLVVTTGSTLYSLYDAPRAARRHNARARRLVLTPAPVIGPDHSSGFGLHLGGQF